jgi:hypothetical protein
VITALSKLVDSNHAKIIPMDKTLLDSYKISQFYVKGGIKYRVGVDDIFNILGNLIINLTMG